MGEIDARALKAARSVARELMADGARAVVLTGSHARGEAHAESDVDLVVVVTKRPLDSGFPVQLRDKMLVTRAWETAASARAALRDPKLAPTFVPGWRDAIVLADPAGVAAKLKQQADAWTWDVIGDRTLDAWVASEINGWAEEVHKIVGALAGGHEFAIAAQRAVVALRLAGIVAVHRRLLYGTENIMWNVVADEMGDEWRAAQRAALSMDRESLEASARGALRLYALAAAEVRRLFDRRQRAVVAHACAIAGWPLD